MLYIRIEAIDGYSSEERAENISKELYYISRPPEVRNSTDLTQYLFDWIKFNGHSFLIANENEIIPVHPENDLTKLIELFPDMSEATKAQLSGFIKSQSKFQFKYIIPSDATYATPDELELINKNNTQP